MAKSWRVGRKNGGVVLEIVSSSSRGGREDSGGHIPQGRHIFASVHLNRAVRPILAHKGKPEGGSGAGKSRAERRNSRKGA